MADKARISSDELRKAAAETESELWALLKAEQLSLFGGDPHHVGYTRTNASGTVSTIAAKNPRPIRPIQMSASSFGAHAHAMSAYAAASGDKTAHRDAADAHAEAADLYETESHISASRGLIDRSTEQGDKAEAHQIKAVEHDREAGDDNAPATLGAAAASAKLQAVAEKYENRLTRKPGSVSEISSQEKNIIPAAEVAGTEAMTFTLADAYGLGTKIKHLSVGRDFATGFLDKVTASGKSSFVLKDPQSGDRYLVDTQGGNYTRYVARIGADVQPAAAPTGKFHPDSPDYVHVPLGDPSTHATTPKAKTTSPKAAAKELKSILESADFGMTEAGGNGRVKANADGTLTVYDSFFYGQNEAMDRHKAAWSPGGHNADYFAEQGFDVKVTGTDTELRSKVFGKKANLGHVAVTIAVTKKPPVAKSLREEITSATMLLKSHVKAYQRTTASGASVTVKEHDDSRQKKNALPHGDANAKHWANLPDDENPKYTLSGISSEALSHSVKGKDDLNRRAKVELANRGLDSDGKWIGFDKADQHHGLTEEEKGGDPDGDEVSGHLQLAHNKVLSAAAKGHLDLNKRAKHELANRGHDSNGKWIGFDAAEKHHGVK